jgi:hypothetical protein
VFLEHDTQKRDTLYEPVIEALQSRRKSPTSNDTHLYQARGIDSLPVHDEAFNSANTSKPPNVNTVNDYMHIEDRPDRIFIRDLDEELAEIESDEDNPIFLSDIEKHLSKIPKHVLQSNEDRELQANAQNQLVLYSVPASLTLDRHSDGVRKAIEDVRKRIREGQGFNDNAFGCHGIMDNKICTTAQAPTHSTDARHTMFASDADEMDIEEEL